MNAHPVHMQVNSQEMLGQPPQADAHVRAYHIAKRPVPFAAIVSAVAGHFNVPPADILSNSRKHPYVRPRQVAMHLYRTLSGRSFPEIGRRFGRDHTTALSNCRRIRAMIAEGHPIAQDVEALRQKLMRDRA